MKTFKDNAGRDWTVSVTTAAIKRLRGVLEIDLMHVVEGDLLKKLYADPVLLVDVIYVLCKPQADAAEITDEQFGEAMAGDAIELATTALIDEIIGFFPNRRDRDRARKVMEKFRVASDRVQDALDLRADSPAIDREIDQLVASAGEPSSGSPESQESIPVS